MEWVWEPLTIGVLVIAVAVAFASAALRHWSPRATLEYVVAWLLILFALRWAIEIGDPAIYAAALAGIGTGLAMRAIERSRPSEQRGS